MKEGNHMTVHIPKFQLKDTTTLGFVSLKVANLATMTSFYHEVIGLTVIEQTDAVVTLGNARNDVLLVLNKIDNPVQHLRRTGLFHVAFLLPTRAELGDALRHYLTIKAPLEGASDHGYSEALYLSDPEGNGIEVYRDKPKSDWDVREDGEVVGITIEMDAEGVLRDATGDWCGFSEAVSIGHVHLKVSDLSDTEAFYTEGLGLSLKTNLGDQAKFFAIGGYHHHLGTNVWMGRDVPPMGKHDLGLHYYTFNLATQSELKELRDHLTDRNISVTELGAKKIEVTDPNGIRVQFKVSEHRM